MLGEVVFGKSVVVQTVGSVATMAVRNNRQAWSLGHGHTHAHDHHVHAAVTALPVLLIRGTEGETVPPDLDRETGVEVYR